MSLPVQPPRLITPPDEYDRTYMDLLLAELRSFISLLNTPGELRGSAIHLTNVPDDPAGYSIGTVYQKEGVLMVVREQDIFFYKPDAGETGLGTVTVTV